MILNKDFFNKNTIFVAQNLLGKVLIKKNGNEFIKDFITEVEVYDGLEDLASHASCGITERNKIMFGSAGYWYVYLVYGMHWMLNIVTREERYPAAILIRGTSRVCGPARLTKFFGISKKFHGTLANRKSGLWIEDGGSLLVKNIKSGPRIGVGYAGPIWSKKKWRFFV